MYHMYEDKLIISSSSITIPIVPFLRLIKKYIVQTIPHYIFPAAYCILKVTKH